MNVKKIEVGTYLTWDREEGAERIDMGIRPIFKTQGAACADLAIPRDEIVKPHKAAKIDLNIRLDIPEGYKAIIYPRSSLLPNYGIIQPVSIIDCDYKGHVHVPLYNLTNDEILFKRGTRVAQIEIVKMGLRPTEWEVENNVRDQNGFGGTGAI